MGALSHLEPVLKCFVMKQSDTDDTVVPNRQVFGDRLTDNQDSKWMTSQIKSILDHGSAGTAQCE